jgi:hypothetical protein
MIDKSIESNDVLKVVAVHDSLSGWKGFRHVHGPRPSAGCKQREQCYPNRGMSITLSHGRSRSPVAGSITGIVEIGYTDAHHSLELLDLNPGPLRFDRRLDQPFAFIQLTGYFGGTGMRRLLPEGPRGRRSGARWAPQASAGREVCRGL